MIPIDVRVPCTQSPHLFHAPDQERVAARRQRETLAKTVCATCDWAAGCLEDAMRDEAGRSIRHIDGIRGGLTPEQRHGLRRRAS